MDEIEPRIINHPNGNIWIKRNRKNHPQNHHGISFGFHRCGVKSWMNQYKNNQHHGVSLYFYYEILPKFSEFNN